MKGEMRRLLVGRTIVGLRTNPFDDGRGGKAFNHELVLDNGTSVFIETTETEVGDYGNALRIENTIGRRRRS